MLSIIFPVLLICITSTYMLVQVARGEFLNPTPGKTPAWFSILYIIVVLGLTAGTLLT